jgi:hypothetical protein
LKSLTKQAITCLVQEDMYEVTIELFSDVLANYSKFLADGDFDLLFSLFNSDWSKERYRQLVQGDFGFESLQYGHFIIAFGDARVEQLAKASDPLSQQFLEAIEGLLAAEGYPVAEDQIFIPALEFWSTFVEVMIDSLYSDEDVTLSILNARITNSAVSTDRASQKEPSSGNKNEWFVTARASVMRAIERCWRKIQFPPADVFDDWDSVDRAGFSDARMEVVDLLQASYTLTGLPLFSMFADLTLHSLQTGAWNELEASLFCLGSLVDCISDDDMSDAILEKVISSTLFATLADSASNVPLRTRLATLSLIGKYDEFFKAHTQYIPEALTFLFKALSIPSLAATASKSIQSLCSSCRQALTSELSVFVQQYNELTTSHSFDGIVKERIAGAIAAVIQAISSEDLKLLPLLGLLQSVDTDFQRTLRLHASGNIEEAEACGIDVLRCIASLAKGLQAPSDIPLELSENGPMKLEEFWVSGPGSSIQNHVGTIIDSLMNSFPQSGEIVESACTIFRAGFTERVPGPFVFPAKTVVRFLVKTDPRTPRLVVVISTACSFVSAHGTNTTSSVNEALYRLCAWLLSLLETLQGKSFFLPVGEDVAVRPWPLYAKHISNSGIPKFTMAMQKLIGADPSNDPEIAQTGIDFLHRLLPTQAKILLGQPSPALEFLFIFVLKALRGRDPLPKFAAADFWV